MWLVARLHSTGAYKHLVRRHLRHNNPFLVADVFIDKTLAIQISHDSLEHKTALSLLAELPDIEISDVQQTMTLGEADMTVAQQLNIPLNSPVACVQRSASDSQGRLILVSNGIYRGDVVRVDMKLK